MKVKLQYIVIFALSAMFSSATIAGGPHCDSFKQHNSKVQESMSAEEFKEFKKNHSWNYSEGHKKFESKGEVKQKQQNFEDSSNKLIGA